MEASSGHPNLSKQMWRHSEGGRGWRKAVRCNSKLNFLLRAPLHLTPSTVPMLPTVPAWL